MESTVDGIRRISFDRFKTIGSRIVRKKQMQIVSSEIHRNLLLLFFSEENLSFEILNGERCEPVLIFDILCGGSSLSLLRVSESLLEIRFVIVDTEQDRVHFYLNDNFLRSTDVEKPIRSCAMTQRMKSAYHFFLLVEKPKGIDEIKLSIGK